MATTTVTERRVVQLDIDAASFKKALGNLDSGMQSVARNTKQTADNIRQLNRVVTATRNALAAVFLARQVFDYISSIQSLENALRTVVSTTEQLEAVQGRLFEVSQETRGSFEGTVTLFTRLARVNTELGLSYDELEMVVTNVNKALAAGGATAQETRSTLLQLAQAIGSGRLSGDEFRSISEAAPLILQALSESLDVPIGKLKQLGAEGKLSAKVVTDALKQADNITEAFAKTNITLSQAIQKLTDRVRQLGSEANRSVPVFDALAAGLNTVADNAELVINAVAVLGAGFALTKLQAVLSGLVVSTGSLAGAVTLVTTGLAAWAIPAAVVFGVATLIKEITDLNQLTDDFAASLSVIGLRVADFVINYLASFYRQINFFGVLDDVIAGLDAYGGEARAELASVEGALKRAAETRKRIRAQQLGGVGGEGGVAQAVEVSKELLAIWERALEDIRTPQEAFIERLKEIQTAAIAVGASQEQLAEVITKLSREYYAGTEAGKAFAAQQKAIADAASEANAAFDIQSILGETERALGDLQEAFSRGLIAEQTFLLAREQLFKDSNERIIESVGGVYEVLANAAEDFTSSFADTFIDAATGADDAWQQFATDFIKNIAKMAAETLILIPLLESVKSLIASMAVSSTTATTTTATPNAHGNAFGPNGIVPFARGGVVNQPTPFLFGKGGTALGVMGEAGTEAIMPLKRGKDGNLGVAGSSTPVNVTVINNSNSGVDVQERSGPNGIEIDVIVGNAVRSQLQSGSLDDVLDSNFGLSRRGQ